MPFTKFSNLDFDQIKTSIKDYLRANSNFTDFDFEGSNFSVLIDTLAYNTYITAFKPILIFESLSLISFGISWLIKGETLFKDKDKKEFD